MLTSRHSDDGPQELQRMESLVDTKVLQGEDSVNFGTTCQAIAEIVSSRLYKYAPDTKCLNTYFKNTFDLYRHQVLKYVEFAQVFDSLKDFGEVPTSYAVARQFCKLSSYPDDWRTLWQHVLDTRQPVSKDLVVGCWSQVLKQKEIDGATQLLGMRSNSDSAAAFESVVQAAASIEQETAAQPAKNFFDNEALKKDMDFILLSLRRLKASGVVMEILTPQHQWIGSIQDIRFVPDTKQQPPPKVAIPKLPSKVSL